MSRQLGHFLTTVSMGYQTAIHPEAEVQALDRLAAIVRHEMYPDGRGSLGVVVSTARQALRPGLGDVVAFLDAVRLDAAGQYQERDARLHTIFDPARNGAPEKRLGNSMEDLGLSVRGWRLRHMVPSGELGTSKDLASWIALNVAG